MSFALKLGGKVGRKGGWMLMTAGYRAGGGGQTAFRKQKLAEKNHKLMEQRQRKAEAVKTGRAEKVKNAPPKDEAPKEEDRGSVHPSRRRRVNKK